jgi:hypothetical protein
MADDPLITALGEIKTLLKGLSIEIEDSRRHASTSDEFILGTLKDLGRLLDRMQVSITKRRTQPKESP